jgi:hypothetical protein
MRSGCLALNADGGGQLVTRLAARVAAGLALLRGEAAIGDPAGVWCQ